MKKQISLIALLFTFSSFHTSYSQAVALNSKSNAYTSILTKDSGLSHSALLSNSAAFNAKAFRIVKRSFKNAKEETWYKLESGYMARFVKDNVPTTVYFNNKGSWEGTIRKMTEKQAPNDIRVLLKTNFLDYTINQIQEINVEIHKVFIAYLENETSFVNVRICDGDMDILKEIKK